MKKYFLHILFGFICCNFAYSQSNEDMQEKEMPLIDCVICGPKGCEESAYLRAVTFDRKNKAASIVVYDKSMQEIKFSIGSCRLNADLSFRCLQTYSIDDAKVTLILAVNNRSETKFINRVEGKKKSDRYEYEARCMPDTFELDFANRRSGNGR